MIESNCMFFTACFSFDHIVILIVAQADAKPEKKTNHVYCCLVLGQIFSLKLIIYGTKEDPLTDNSHVDKTMKRVVKFTGAQIQKRRKGQF